MVKIINNPILTGSALGYVMPELAFRKRTSGAADDRMRLKKTDEGQRCALRFVGCAARPGGGQTLQPSARQLRRLLNEVGRGPINGRLSLLVKYILAQFCILCLYKDSWAKYGAGMHSKSVALEARDILLDSEAFLVRRSRGRSRSLPARGSHSAMRSL